MNNRLCFEVYDPENAMLNFQIVIRGARPYGWLKRGGDGGGFIAASFLCACFSFYG